MRLYAWLSVPSEVEASVCVVKCSKEGEGVDASVCVVKYSEGKEASVCVVKCSKGGGGVCMRD